MFYSKDPKRLKSNHNIVLSGSSITKNEEYGIIISSNFTTQAFNSSNESERNERKSPALQS